MTNAVVLIMVDDVNRSALYGVVDSEKKKSRKLSTVQKKYSNIITQYST